MTFLNLKSGYTVAFYENHHIYKIMENGTDDFLVFEYVDPNTMYFADNTKAALYTVSHDNQYEYTYKCMKTKVKAIGGADGLYRHFSECIEKDFAVESWVIAPIKQILKSCKAKKGF